MTRAAREYDPRPSSDPPAPRRRGGCPLLALLLLATLVRATVRRTS